MLRAAVQHARAKAMKEEYWISAIMSALAACRIDCVPGSYHGRLSYRRMTRLVGNVPAPSAIAARPGSLKRAAIEAVHQAKRRSQTKSTIDFGCQIPFNAIPPLVEKGFQQLDGQFSKSGMNQKVREHYHRARQCLIECLGQPKCDLMLMLVLTLASSSATPTVAVNATEFSKGPTKNSEMFAAALVTRMLWSLRPDYFPSEEDDGWVLSVREMTKKIGKTSLREALFPSKKHC